MQQPDPGRVGEHREPVGIGGRRALVELHRPIHKRSTVSGAAGSGVNDVEERKGLAVGCHESDVRATGRTSYGVKATSLDEEGDEVVSMVGVKRQSTLLTVCATSWRSSSP